MLKTVLITTALLVAVAKGAEVEPNGTIGQANLLVLDSSGHGAITGRINALSDLDAFKIVTPPFSGRGNLTLTMTPTSADRELDASLQVLNSFGALLASADLRSDNVPESLTVHDFGGGQSFYAICSSSDLSASGTGDYTLQVTFTVTQGLFGTIRKPLDATDYPVAITSLDGTKVAPQKRTWIVIHGWNSSPAAPNITSAAEALVQTRTNEQVLTLDWSSAAQTIDPSSAENSIVPVAKWAANALIQSGFSGTNLNLVGHSFGSYVADEIAHRIPGGVDTIVALDPAADVLGGYNPVANDEVDFARDSEFSWAFHASSLGNEYTPTRADEAFIVDSDVLLASTAHSAVVLLFAYFILHPTDPVGRFFLLTSLLADLPGPWLPNQYMSSFAADAPVIGFEAVITSTNGGTQPLNLQYVPLPLLVAAKDFGLVTVSWPTNYPSFSLESSASLAAGARWESVPLPISVTGRSNVLRLHDDSNRFFRLKHND